MQINYGIDNMVKTIQKIDGGTISNKYDTANRLIAEHQNQFAKFAVNYTLDPVGNPTNTLITVDGTPIITNDYTFDAAERISTINNGQSGTFAYQYNQYNGLLASASNTTAGITAAYQYDNMDRLINITWRKPSGAILRSFGYQYNTAGCITNITNGSDTLSLEWNSQYQITAIATNGTTAETYTYDPYGRRATISQKNRKNRKK